MELLLVLVLENVLSYDYCHRHNSDADQLERVDPCSADQSPGGDRAKINLKRNFSELAGPNHPYFYSRFKLNINARRVQFLSETFNFDPLTLNQFSNGLSHCPP